MLSFREPQTRTATEIEGWTLLIHPDALRLFAFGEIVLRLSPPGHNCLTQATACEVRYGGGGASALASAAAFGLDARTRSAARWR